jgi:hypothetical protein
VARSFASASSQYLAGSPPLTAPPFSLAARVKYPSTGANRNAFSLHHNGSSTRWSGGVDSSGNSIIRTMTGTSTGAAVPTGVWTWLVCVWRAHNDRSLWVNTSETTNTSNLAPSNTPDELTIACNRSNTGTLQQFWNGEIAEAAMYDAGLGAADVAMLVAGASPLGVRAGNLVSYWPLLGRASPEIDLVGRFELSLVNSPTTADHPPVYAPTSIRVGVPSGSTLISDAVIPAAWCGSLQADAALPLAWLASVAASSHLPADWSAALRADCALALAWQGTLAADGLLPTSHLGSLQADGATTASWLAALAAGGTVPAQWLALISAAGIVPVAWGGIVAEQLGPPVGIWVLDARERLWICDARGRVWTLRRA